MLILRLLFFVSPIFAYVQIPLTKVVNYTEISYNIPVIINDHDYKIGITFNNQEEYIKPLNNVQKDKKHRKVKKNSEFRYGILKAKSVQIGSFEGWRRYFAQALFFETNEFHYELDLQLDDIKIKEQNISTLNDGLMLLSPRIQNNKWYTEIKKNTPDLMNDVFAIYMGISENEHRLQLGGYDLKLGNDGYKKIPLVQSDTDWIIQTQKLLLSKENNNKWREYNLDSNQPRFKISLNTNKMILKRQVFSVLQIALESQNITCKMDKMLICENLTSIQLSLHMVVLQITPQIFINITLYRLLNSCDDKKKQCKFNIQEGEQYVLGSYFFIEYYSIFNMNEKSLFIATCNKYPNFWFNSIYIVRFFVIFFLFCMIGLIIIALPQMYDNYLRWKKKNSGIQGIQLVSGRENTKLDLEIE